MIFNQPPSRHFLENRQNDRHAERVRLGAGTEHGILHHPPRAATLRAAKLRSAKLPSILTAIFSALLFCTEILRPHLQCKYSPAGGVGGATVCPVVPHDDAHRHV